MRGSVPLSVLTYSRLHRPPGHHRMEARREPGGESPPCEGDAPPPGVTTVSRLVGRIGIVEALRCGDYSRADTAGLPRSLTSCWDYTGVSVRNAHRLCTDPRPGMPLPGCSCVRDARLGSAHDRPFAYGVGASGVLSTARIATPVPPIRKGLFSCSPRLCVDLGGCLTREA